MTEQEFDYIRKLLLDRSSVVLEADKRYLVETRLAPILRQMKIGTISDLVRQIRAEPDNGLPTRVVEALVTTETSFFRDIHPFESLRKVVLPELIAKRAADRRLRIWCAASSSGQEPYSLALLLKEHFPELANWQIDLRATDVSQEMLSRARAGKFSQIEVNRGLSAALLVKYFRQEGVTWELDEGVRRMVDFSQLNLAQPWPYIPAMDIILIRNVMIYFDVATKKAILERAARVLKPDGYLVLGGAETTFNLHDGFKRVEDLKSGFYRLVR
jgi:chemotaxis protein methyltransferase CheR